MKCPLCNWDLDTNGQCTNTVSHCTYKGRGLSRAEIIEQSRGWQLGDITGPQNRNNGAGCYDDDEDEDFQ